MNPYEAPQTIDTPPPLAEEVRVVSVDFAALAEAAADCSRAGKFYIITIVLITLELVGLSMMPQVMKSMFGRLLLAAPFLGGLFFFVSGILLNAVACRQFKFELPGPKLKKLYASCQRASLLKAVLIVYLPLIPIISHPVGQPSRYAELWNVFMFLIPAIVLLINSVVTVILHFRGINELGEMLQTKVVDKLATLFLFSGVQTVLLSVSVLLRQAVWHESEPPTLLLVGAPLLLLPMFAAYQAAYRRLSHAFLARGEKA